jgi:RNA polymerase sigma-70 factor (ECF subfamily)
VAADVLDRFFREHFPVIRAKCARMLGDTEEAADIAQETFLRLYSSEVAHQQPAARLTWIYQTSTRLAIDRLRRQRLGVEVPAHEEVDTPGRGPAADEVIAARQWLGRVAEALPPDELEVAILSRFDRMTHDEIAAVTEMSSRSVRRILGRLDERLDRLGRRLG